MVHPFAVGNQLSRVYQKGKKFAKAEGPAYLAQKVYDNILGAHREVYSKDPRGRNKYIRFSGDTFAAKPNPERYKGKSPAISRPNHQDTMTHYYKKRKVSRGAMAYPDKYKGGKKRKGGGKRKTRTKGGKKRSKGSKMLAGSGYLSYNKIAYKKPKMAKYVTWAKQPLTYDQLTTFSVATTATSDQGKQLMSMINDSTSTGINASGTLVTLWETHAKLRNSTGPAWITLDGNPSSSHYNSLYLASTKVEWTYTNQAPTTVEADLYIVTRKVSDKSTFASNQPFNDWDGGLTKSAADLTAVTRDSFGLKPTVSKQFNMNWVILKVVKVVLEPGQEHKHQFTFKPKRVIDLGHAGLFVSGIKGIDIRSFMICRGPVADTSNDFAAGSISSTRVKVVGIQKVSYVVYALNVFPKLTGQNSTITTSNAALYSIADAAGTVVNTETNTNYA